MMKISVTTNFDGGSLERDLKRQMEQQIRKALSGPKFSGLKIEFRWDQSEPVRISGPDDQVADALKVLKSLSS